MSNAGSRLSRRTFLKGAATVTGGALLAACAGAPAQPKAAAPEAPKEEAAPQEAPKAAEGVQELRLSVWADVQDAVVYEGILKAWHGKQDKYKATMEQYPGGYYEKIQANFAGGTSADVLYYQGWIWQAYAEDEVIQPLDEFISGTNSQAKFPAGENYENTTRWHGKTYMTPTDVGSLVIYYNKDLFDKKGVPYPKKGWTWDEFKDAVQKLSYTEGDTRYYGWAQAGGWNGAYGRVCAFFRRNGYVEWDKVIEPTKSQWNHPDLESAMQFMIYDAIENEWSPSPDVIAGGGVGVDTGRCAMVFEGPWYMPRLSGELATMKEQGGIKYDVAEPPVGTANRNTTFGHVHGHCMATSTKVKEGSWDLIQFILSDEGQQIIANGGRMCGHPDNIDKIWGPIATKNYSFTNTEAFSNGMREGATPLIMGQGATINAYGGGPITSMWDAVLGLQKKAADALAEAEPQIQAALDDYWKGRQK